VSAVSVPIVDEGSLPEAFRAGLRAIRTRVLPTVSIIAVIDNFAILDLGTMQQGGSDTSAELPPIYEEAAVRLFARAPLNFPHAEPYGVMTIPSLRRADKRPMERHHPSSSHATAKSFGTLIGEADVGFWSFDWTGMPRREPADLVAIVEWARKRIRQG